TCRMSTHDIADTVKQYCGTFGLSANAKKLKSIVEDAYLQNQSLATATRHMVNELFKLYGLVIVDADSKGFKNIFAPIIAQDIFEQHSFRSEEHTSELQSRENLVCRLLLEKKDFSI